MKRTLGLAVIGIAMSGCSSRDAQLVGTWKARKVEVAKSQDPLSGIANGFASMMTDGMTLEFNKSREFKVSLFMGSATGKVSYDGEEIVLTPDSSQNSGNVKQTSTMRLKFTANGALQMVKKFDSDPDLIFERVKS